MTSAVSAPVLHILLALSDRPRHGYAIIQEIERQTRASVRLGTGTLYSALKRLREDGLIEEAEDPEGARTGNRPRRTYKLTRRGRSELAQQTERLAVLVDHARQKNALPVPRTAS